MESSHFAQRVLTLMSLLVLGVSGAAWWWVAKEPTNSTPVAPQVTLQAPIDPPPRNEIPSDPIIPPSAASLAQLASFQKPAQDALPSLPPSANAPSPTTSLAIPDAGVQVPAASAIPFQSSGIKFSGFVTFVNDVKVVAQADGVIREFLVEEGSIIERDKVMVEIDNRLAKAEQEVARKELESAQLKADDESQIKFAEASEEVAHADHDRTKDLYEHEVANIDEYERKRLEWIKARFSIDVSKREKKINQAAVGVSEAKLNAAGVQVELRTIRAPFTGIIAKTEKENFEWVKTGDEILRIVSLEKFRVRGQVQINDSPNILERARARVFVQVQPGQVEVVDGVVGFVAPETKPTVEGRNEYSVWVEIGNRIVDGKFLFRGGMAAFVEIYPNR
jgi:multidrug efflux pump subunit AcrA (membrane-fusion protein)